MPHLAPFATLGLLATEQLQRSYENDEKAYGRPTSPCKL